MLPYAALAFITPVFGLSLELDTATLELPLAPQAVVAQLDAAEGLTDESAPGDVEPMPSAPADETSAPSDDAAATADAPESVAEQMERRNRIARAHRRLGLATFGAMTATVISGTLQYANLYGFFAPRSETRCSGAGRPFYGNDACVGTPIPHLVTSLTTGALYFTTFGLSFRMPDPIGLDVGDSESARELRQHKRMRWVHLTGMLFQTTFGMFIANPTWMGLDRANDYRTLQALATVHLFTGYATYGVLTYTGARMAF